MWRMERHVPRGGGNSLKPSHNHGLWQVGIFNNLALWGEKKFVSELKRTYKFQRGVNNRLDCHANQTRILSKEYSFVAGDYVRSTARNDVKRHTEDNSPKYRMVGKMISILRSFAVQTRIFAKECNIIAVDYVRSTAQDDENLNRLRNKCAMTCFGKKVLSPSGDGKEGSVGEMKQNNFNDKVYSLFTTHHSLKRAGATHVALCESVGSYFRHWCGAFTLAEVLITLGIIGVVAAMTMQIIIPNIQDKQLTAMWKKKYSEISSIYFQVREEMGGGDICVESKSGGYANVIKCSKIKQWSGYGTLSPEFVEKFVAKLIAAKDVEKNG